MSSGMKKFFLLWMGELISSIGGGLTSFGLGVYVFQKTGSAAGMALVTLLGFLPTLLFTVPAGVLADRSDDDWRRLFRTWHPLHFPLHATWRSKPLSDMYRRVR